MSNFRRAIGKLLCWWGYHRWGEMWSVPSEHEELNEEGHFVTCQRCGESWRVL
jgi:hypothetical protein